MPARIQRQRTRGWRMPPNTVSVTRPGPYGNPYYPGCGQGFGNVVDGALVDWPLRTKADMVRHFREHMRLMRLHEPQHFDVFIAPLRGKDVACWCKPDEPCHGDVLIEFAESEEDDAWPPYA